LLQTKRQNIGIVME